VPINRFLFCSLLFFALLAPILVYAKTTPAYGFVEGRIAKPTFWIQLAPSYGYFETELSIVSFDFVIPLRKHKPFGLGGQLTLVQMRWGHSLGPFGMDVQESSAVPFLARLSIARYRLGIGFTPYRKIKLETSATTTLSFETETFFTPTIQVGFGAGIMDVSLKASLLRWNNDSPRLDARLAIHTTGFAIRFQSTFQTEQHGRSAATTGPAWVWARTEFDLRAQLEFNLMSLPHLRTRMPIPHIHLGGGFRYRHVFRHILRQRTIEPTGPQFLMNLSVRFGWDTRTTRDGKL
jgi:hypothetical protein